MENYSQNEYTTEELMVAKVKCLEDTLFFTRFFFKDLMGKRFTVGEHHKIIADKLDEVYNGKCKRLIINISPRYGKTELAVKMFIAKGLALNAKSKFIHLSYSDDLALDNSEWIKDIVKLPLYQRMFPDVKIKSGSDSKKKWYTEEGGGVYATSAGGQITGFGAGAVDPDPRDIAEAKGVSVETLTEEDPGIFDDWFCDPDHFGGAIIIDDPIKPDDADSDTIRDRVNARYDSTIENRTNSRHTPIIIIMQRLHEKDFSWYVKTNYPEFEVISMPVIKEDGTALWPHKHTIEELIRRRDTFTGTAKHIFETQMMQNPRPKEGIIFDEDKLQYYVPSEDLTKAFESSLAYVDVADQGTDDLSMPIGRNIGRTVYITDWVHCQAVINGEDIGKLKCAKVIEQQKTKMCRVESNAMGAMFGRNLRSLVNKFSCMILLINSGDNKHSRIVMSESFVYMNMKFIHPKYQSKEYKAAMYELCRYRRDGKEKKDDAPDAISGLAAFIESYFSKYYL